MIEATYFKEQHRYGTIFAMFFDEIIFFA